MEVILDGACQVHFCAPVDGSYLHFARQTKKMLVQLDLSIEFAQTVATYPRSVDDLKKRLSSDSLNEPEKECCERSLVELKR